MTSARRMTRSMGVSFRSTIKSVNFWLAAIAIFAVLLIEQYEEIVELISRDKNFFEDMFGAAYQFTLSTNFGYYIYAAPIACAFAASGEIVNDLEEGFYRLRLMKSGRREYRYGAFVGSTLCGGLALMLGVMAFALVCAVMYGTYQPIEDLAHNDAWMPIVSGANAHWKYMTLHALDAMMFGMVWSGIGMTISVISPSRYVSYFAPFIICFCSALVLPAGLQPLEMLLQLGWMDFTFPKMIAYQAILYILTMAWFSYEFEKRVVHGKN